MQIRDRIKELRRVKASDLLPNPKNWRTHPQHQQDAMKGVLAEIGYADALLARETPEGLMLVDGHLRAETSPLSDVPVLVLDIDEAEADVMLATLDPLASLAGRDDSALTALLEDVDVQNEALSHMLEEMKFDMTVESLDDAKDSLKKPHDSQKRTLPIDMFITGMHPPYCCLAVVAGMKYGTRSTSSDGRVNNPPKCLSFYAGRHELQFIDNEFADYNHEIHVDFVKQYSPKYATVRDIMTESQCREAGIDFYSLAQVLEFADELRQHTENVIVIPKYDCLDDIPADVVLGYSIPTSYGGTPLPIEAFQGRPVHLLGGSWTQQRNALEILGDDVISVDNNQVMLLSGVGSYYLADGSIGSISDLHLNDITNPGVIAYTISCGAMAAGLKELMGEDVTEIDEEIHNETVRD